MRRLSLLFVLCEMGAVAKEPILVGRPLRLPLARATGAAPPYLEERHMRRRLGDAEGRAVIRANLVGNLQLGYFSTVVGFGTPAQFFELIVDTGSGVTAVPCAGCSQCGAHRKFDRTLSTTAVVCKGQGCNFSIAYQEGSAYRGIYLDDRIFAGSAHSCAAIVFRFGCSHVETGLFRSQQADGILGLSPAMGQRRTLQDVLVARGLVSDTLSICIAPQRTGGRGFLEFGGKLEPPERVPSEAATLVSSPLTSTRAYLLTVSSIRLGATGASLGKPGSTLLDSGTTFVYLGISIFTPLLGALTAVKLEPCHLRKMTAPRHDEMCVAAEAAGPSPMEPMEEVLDKCFPELNFQMPNGTLRARPSAYFYDERKGGQRQGVWCVGIFRNHNDQLVLGASVLQNQLVTLDRTQKRVSFTPHECAAKPTELTAEGGAEGASSALVTGDQPESGQPASCHDTPELLPAPRPVRPPQHPPSEGAASQNNAGSGMRFPPKLAQGMDGLLSRLHWPDGEQPPLYLWLIGLCALVVALCVCGWTDCCGLCERCARQLDSSMNGQIDEAELESIIDRVLAKRRRGLAPPPADEEGAASHDEIESISPASATHKSERQSLLP